MDLITFVRKNRELNNRLFNQGNKDVPENPAGKIEGSKLSSLKLVPLKKSFSKELFVICGVVIRTIRLIVLELLIKRIQREHEEYPPQDGYENNRQLNVIARAVIIHPDLVNMWKNIGYYEIKKFNIKIL
ncbi:hypothetical protein C1645_817025 [Glomus cerebriforme]|uniref:Uncharacterized protein n=1 Tax=Glomus cerebriforme TaxID=658196 RepID=A0A397TCV7_9GLOM|nr:hypothetical protein C1645_817025 [Glomus cerebriforme]